MHFVATVIVCIPAAILVFIGWYPNGLAALLGGTTLFLMLIGCDLVLGPMMSLVIFNRAKSKSELFRDYAIVAMIQFSALLYGLTVVAASRPVFIVFSKDRLEIVTAIEIDPADLAVGTNSTGHYLSWTGPTYGVVQVPTDPTERSEALIAAIAGKDLHLRPRFYGPYFKSDVLTRSSSLDKLRELAPHSGSALFKATDLVDLPAEKLLWLPAHHRFGFAVALIDPVSALPVKFLPIDPY